MLPQNLLILSYEILASSGVVCTEENLNKGSYITPCYNAMPYSLDAA